MADQASGSGTGDASGRMQYLAGVDEALMPARKRTKTRRACLYCRRSHMTCEETRPCTRCCKRQIAHLCTSDADAEDKAAAERPVKAQKTKRASTKGSGADSTLPTPYPNISTSDSKRLEMVPNAAQLLYLPTASSETRPWIGGVPPIASTSSAAPLLALPLNGQDTYLSPTNSTTGSLSNFWTDWDWLETSLAKTSGRDPFEFVAGNLNGTSPEEKSTEEGGSPLVDVVRLRSQVLSLPHAEEDEMVQPNNYTFGYSRLKRWSSERSAEVHDAIEMSTSIFRPVLHKRLAACSDEELIASEIAFRSYVKTQQQALQILPVAACVWRRTGELYVANKRMYALTETAPRMWQAGKLCLYDILDPASFIEYWRSYSENVLPHIENNEGWEIDFKGGLRKVNSNDLTTCQVSCSVVLDDKAFPLAVLGVFVPIAQ